jgi:hypothetical protein
MITMTTMTPELINMGCSSGVWGFKRGGLIRLSRAGGTGWRSPEPDHGALQPVYV